MPPAAAIGAVGLGSIGAGIYGNMQANNRAKSAQQTAIDAQNRILGVQTPDYNQMQLQLEQLVQQGVLSPQMEQSILQNPSAANELIQQDPRLRQADLDALSTLSNISNSKGNDAQAQFATQQAMNQAQGQARGARMGNLQNAAQRGVSGSGLEFVSNQLADQGGANQAQMAGLQNAAASQSRNLQALQGLTGLTGQMNSQDFARQQAVARARDQISQFNTLTQQDVQRRNVGAQNQAQAQNLANAQQIANYNVGLSNQQQQYNKQLPEQQYKDKLAQMQAAAGQTGQIQGAQYQQGQNQANLYGGIGQGIAGIGSQYLNYQNNQPKADVQQGKSQYQNANGEWVDYP